MKLLVIGSGGREHALTWKLAQSQHASRIWCAPGNAGTSRERLARNSELVQNVPIGAEDLPALLAFALENKPDLTIVGPDNPLAAGIVDLFQAKGLRIWGPNQRAAQFEASKVFAQDFMQRHGIPTAASGSFDSVPAAREFARGLGWRCAVKADGLALGKGVIMCSGEADVDAALEEILLKRSFGAAGNKVLLQEFLEGTEVSLHALCDGSSLKLFPTSQDHKRALDDDEGLNTGGMGTISPAPYLSDAQLQDCQRKILDPWLAGCQAEGIDFRGILYPGLMLTKNGPKVLEFNARFGDPETQVYLTRLKSDLVELLSASTDGTLGKTQIQWSDKASVCVVMASGGYPGPYPKGLPISGLKEAAYFPNAKVFHAGTAEKEDKVVTNGGRVLGVTAWAGDLEDARNMAYRVISEVWFDGAHFRRDIGAKAVGFTSGQR